ncbi:MAG: PAS domain S-box protein [Flavobacteriales bacterium]|nr:PAS domain S-box protein [Flavobacteriales bacterium]
MARSLLGPLSEGVLIVQKGRVVVANPRAGEMLGGALEGTRAADIFHPEDRPGLDALMHRAGAAVVRTVQGNPVAVRTEPLPGQDMVQLALTMAVMPRPDALQREKAEHRRTHDELVHSKSFSRHLVDHSPDMIMAADPQGRITEFNPAALERFGYRLEEVLGRPTTIIYADPVEMEHVLHEMSARGLYIGEVRNITKSGEVFTAFLSATRLYDEQGVLIGAMGVSRDVRRERQAGERLREQEAKLKALFESSEHMFWTMGPGILLTSYNRAYAHMLERLYGVPPKLNREAGFRRQRFASADYHDFWEGKYARAFAGEQVRFETDIRDIHGGRVCNEIFLSPVFDAEGRVKEVFGVGHEITGQKEAQDLVRAQGARLRAIFENSANMMFWTLDRDFRITSFNEHFHLSIAEAHGVHFAIGDAFIDQMVPRVARGEHAPIVQRFRTALKGEPQQFEVELVDQRGESVWVENFLNPIMIDGQVRELSCLAYGITDRKQAQRELVQSLNEKEVLLKEVHHRVKNNLQIVSSIFSLQAAHAGNDRRMLDLLRDSRDRIRSMAFIHESLYQNKEFSSVDLARYIEGLSRNLMLSYSHTGRIRLRTDLHEVHLVLDQAIPCGLILNELISNALKHAFPDGRAGTVTIALRHVNDRVSISVSDDGVGMPAGFDPHKHGNLGLELVHTLAEQLDGEVRMTPAPGASYLLTFERTKH